jgi:hypothetical protein
MEDLKVQKTIQINPIDRVQDSAGRIIADNLAAASFSFLLGVFVIVRWLDIPDKVQKIQDDLDKISRRQRRIYNLFADLYHEKHGKIYKGLADDEDSSENV